MRPPYRKAGAEPFFHAGNSIGCLCLHGLGASPDEMRWYGEHLAQQGYTVYGPCLPAHGGDYRLMRDVTWQDWYEEALSGYHLLRAQCEQVVVCGHSMGGLLAILLAAWEDVDALIVLASPLELPNMDTLRRAWLIKRVRPYIDSQDTSHLPEIVKAEQARRGEPVRGRVRYDIWATQAIQNLYELMVHARQALIAVHAPVLALYSTEDKTVPINNQQILIDGLRNTTVTHHRYEVSGHILPQDVERDDVMARSAAFIADKVKQGVS
jgi:carboxylesterase